MAEIPSRLVDKAASNAARATRHCLLQGAMLVFVLAGILAGQLIFGVVVTVARADDLPPCTIDQIAGFVEWTAGSEHIVHIERAGVTYTAKLPTCIQYADTLLLGDGAKVHVRLAAEQTDLVGATSWLAKSPEQQQENSLGAFFGTLFHGITGPTQSLQLYAASRAPGACPPAKGAPPPFAPVGRLRDTQQRIGADLRAIVAIWQPSREPRLVRAKLLRADGSIVVQGATCRQSSLPLLLRSGDLNLGDHLTLSLTDDQGGSLQYVLDVVSPDSLPQPPVKLAQDWLVATWRLAAAGEETRLDSVARVAKASATSFGAQRVLGAVATDTPF